MKSCPDKRVLLGNSNVALLVIHQKHACVRFGWKQNKPLPLSVCLDVEWHGKTKSSRTSKDRWAPGRNGQVLEQTVFSSTEHLCTSHKRKVYCHSNKLWGLSRYSWNMCENSLTEMAQQSVDGKIKWEQNWERTRGEEGNTHLQGDGGQLRCMTHGTQMAMCICIGYWAVKI